MTEFRILPAGDSALVLRLGDRIDPAVNARALCVARELRDRLHSTAHDIVVGYASVTIYFDPLAVAAAEIQEHLRRAAVTQIRAENATGKAVEIPVTYGGDVGPDLPEVAAFAACSAEDVVARHLAREYRVFMVGFLPGFPYMGIVDSSIAMPRRDTPRLAVPKGSVGIAGLQTGIYPVESPGGWRLIGRTDAVMFDPSAPEPTLLKPGDRVRFRRVS
jgi:KipI family sensor histidine kinase inhibitor